MEIGAFHSSSPSQMHSIAIQGLQRASSNMNLNASRIAQGDISAERMVSMHQEMFLYSINIQLLRISDEMVGELLEVFA